MEDGCKKIDKENGKIEYEVVNKKRKSGVMEECEIWKNKEVLKMKKEIKILKSKKKEIMYFMENKKNENEIIKEKKIKLMKMIEEKKYGKKR